MKKRPINSVDLLQSDEGALVVAAALDGQGKPDILSWADGTDGWLEADTGAVTHEASTVFVRVASGGALISFGDEAGSEKPFILPSGFAREFVVAGGITTGARIVAKNLTPGVNFRDLTVEVR